MLRRDDLSDARNKYSKSIRAFLNTGDYIPCTPAISNMNINETKTNCKSLWNEFDYCIDSSSVYPDYQGDHCRGANKGRLSLHLPLTPQVMMLHFKNLLSPYEQNEILSWPAIYFAGSARIDKIGTPKRKTGADFHEVLNVPGIYSDRDGVLYNCGYDDSRGDLYLTKNDHIAYRYEIISLLGKGSFGQVVKCYDHKEKTYVALKIIRNKKRFEKQGIVEVNVLNKLTNEDIDNNGNLVHVTDHFYFRGHLCFVFEILGINLYEWLKSGGFHGVHLGVIRRFSAQMLSCLSLLERLNIIHCDLKPENVLLVDQSTTRPLYTDSNISSRVSKIPAGFDPSLSIYDIKVIDFGSSCYEDERIYSYVQSRFYRSPEVILGLEYTCSIDMWSLGCLLAELYTGYPIFPGENEADQLACIMEICGLPPYNIRGSRYNTFFDSHGFPRKLTNSKGKKRKPASKSISSSIRCADPAFLDFLERCFQWDPALRLKPADAQTHPFVTNSRSIILKSRNPISKLCNAAKSTMHNHLDGNRQLSSGGFKSKFPPITSSKAVTKASSAVAPIADKKQKDILLPSIPRVLLSRSTKFGNNSISPKKMKDNKIDIDAEMALFEELIKGDISETRVREDLPQEELKKSISAGEIEEQSIEESQRYLLQDVFKQKKLYAKAERLKAKRKSLQLQPNPVKKKAVLKTLVKCFEDEFSN